MSPFPSVLLSLALLVGAPALATEGADAPEHREQPLMLKVGGTTTLEAEGLKRVALGDPEVAAVTVDRGVLQVRGLSAGTTTLLLWNQDPSPMRYRVTVSP